MCLRYIQKRGYIFEWKQRKQVRKIKADNFIPVPSDVL